MVKEEDVKEALTQVVDPELGLNIVDLGLVYDVKVDEDNKRVDVNMTLTTPGCPAGDQIMQGAKMVLEEFEDVDEAEVHLVWEPMWNPDMMSDRAKMMFGRF